jgi:hypothetical protein
MSAGVTQTLRINSHPFWIPTKRVLDTGVTAALESVTDLSQAQGMDL